MNITWKDGRSAEATIRSSAGRAPMFRYGDRRKKITLEPGQQVVLTDNRSIRSP